MGITKNRQEKEVICQMALQAFPDKQLEQAVELTEGMCNTAYLISFTDGTKSVLKIASAGNQGRMSNEVNLMKAEVAAMQLVEQAGTVKVAKVLYHDDSNVICDGEYFFMEALEGQSYASIQDTFTEDEKKQMNVEIGKITRKISAISGIKFGLLGESDKCYLKLFDFVYKLVKNVLFDAEQKSVDTVIPTEEILKRLDEDSKVFEQVVQPVLVHWDMWEGNIFVKDKQISGIIDWERAMWGEAFMDDRFRRHTRNAEFLKGYGQETFTMEEMRRICWYDVLLYLTMMTEGVYREYEDDGVYQWARQMFEETWKEITG